MVFRADNQILDTAEMLCLDVEGIYFTIYLDRERQMAFYQTFDDDKGVMINPAPPEQTQALLKRFPGRTATDISTHRDWLRELNPATSPPSRRPAAHDTDWKR